jgi:hypothetical protein
MMDVVFEKMFSPAIAESFSFAGLSPAKEKSTCSSMLPLRLERSGR